MKIRCLVDTYGVNICRIRVPRPTDIFEEPLNPAYCYGALNFNPRSPWGERLLSILKPVFVSLFQSTLPVGGATLNV